MHTIVHWLKSSKAEVGLNWELHEPRLQSLKQQQLSHLSQVFGVGYINQKRITPGRAHGSTFSTHSYRAICIH